MRRTLRELKEQTIPEEEHEWDKRKIAFAVAFAVFLIGVEYYFNVFSAGKEAITSVLGVEFKRPEVKRPAVSNNNQKGKPPSIQEIKSAVESKVEDIQKEVKNLDFNEIASSSPQIQKIIKDIKALEKYPSNQAKQICENICKSL